MSETPIEKPIENEGKSASWKLSAALCVLILLAAGGLAAMVFLTEPTAEKEGAAKRTAMLVEVVEAEQGDFRPRVVAQGTVEPARDVILSPQVGGRVTSLADGFVPGGHVEEGELLMRVESADYQHALAQRRSDLRQARSDLALEQGRHEAAVDEYNYVGEELSPENEALVVRRPQLEAARERVEAARAAVEQAELDVRRTRLEAPFDAHILRRDVNIGSQVSAGDDVGRLVGVDTYWVRVDLPLSKLRWVVVAGEGQQGSPVRVRNRQSWPRGAYREGYLFRRVGALDEQTRMARVLAEIPDPLALEPAAAGENGEEGQRGADERTRPPLIIGEFVDVSIEGVEMKDVIRLDRDYVRQDDTVWVMEDGELRVKTVDIALRDSENAFITGGLDPGAQVVTTNLSTVVEGAPLRLEADETGTAGEEATDE